MYKIPLPALSFLNECFEYDPYTGALTWKRRPTRHFRNDNVAKMWNSKRAGRVAGSVIGSGYIAVSIDNVKFQVHRIVWKIYTGNDPKEYIDHIDGVRSNNAISNLREATFAENQRNRGKTAANSSGYKGVSLHKKTMKYKAMTRVDKQHILLGYFNTPEEAYKAYCDFASRAHGDFYNSGADDNG